jgi:competence protein ComEA
VDARPDDSLRSFSLSESVTLVELDTTARDVTVTGDRERADLGDVSRRLLELLAAAPPAQVHLNSATLADLDGLPGVGSVTAQNILDYRAQHGAFASIDELVAVPGIGPTRLEQLRELLTL